MSWYTSLVYLLLWHCWHRHSIKTIADKNRFQTKFCRKWIHDCDNALCKSVAHPTQKQMARTTVIPIADDQRKWRGRDSANGGQWQWGWWTVTVRTVEDVWQRLSCWGTASVMTVDSDNKNKQWQWGQWQWEWKLRVRMVDDSGQCERWTVRMVNNDSVDGYSIYSG